MADSDALLATALAVKAIKTAQQAMDRLRAPGPHGQPGEPGKHGQRGPQGEPGINGPQGEPGRDGVDGEPGRTGERGPQGLRGDTGERGERGNQGERGGSGEQGPQGDQGERGPQGERGQAGRDAHQLLRAEWRADFTRDAAQRTEQVDLSSNGRRPWRLLPIRDDAGLTTHVQILPID